MLKTHLNINKPLTVFDPKKSKHRQAYYDFHVNNTWGNCQYRFLVEDPYLNLIDCIQHKMLDFYLTREFNKSPRNKDPNVNNITP